MRFSLQTLILATVLLALALGAFGAYGIAVAFVLVLADHGVRQSERKREAVGCLLLILFLVLIVWSSCLPAHSTVMAVPDRVACSIHLRGLAFALHNYHEAHGCFPPAYIPDKDGKPMHSWRVLILPYLECEDVYRQYDFDEPWDGPNNRRLAGQEPTGRFVCPASQTARANPGTTNYLAVTGPNTAWPGAEPFCLDDFEGDAANTILLVEVEDSDVNWMEPRDLTLEEALARLDPASDLVVHPAHPGRHVVALDARPHSLPDHIEPAQLEDLLRTDRDSTLFGATPRKPPPAWCRLLAAMGFVIVFILYVIRRNKDAAAFAARDQANVNRGPAATDGQETASENHDADRPK